MSFLISLIILIISPDQQEYCKLRGAVYIEESPKFANFIVYEEDSEAFADVLIFEEDNKLFADAPGKWYFVDSKGLADFTVYFTEDESKSHFSAYFVDSDTFAGCQ